MNLTQERITRQTERYMYDWIDPVLRASAEKHLPKNIITELRQTTTVGDWHKITSRISAEIWEGATNEEIDAAIEQTTKEIDDMVGAAATMGRKGGSVKSERKTTASRENGRKGGRPRKVKP